MALERRARRAGHWSSVASSGVIPPIVADSDGKLHEKLDEDALGPETAVIPPPPDFERDETPSHRQQIDAVRTWRYPFPTLRDSFAGYEGWLVVGLCVLIGACAAVAAGVGFGAFSWPASRAILAGLLVCWLLVGVAVIMVGERLRKRRHRAGDQPN